MAEKLTTKQLRAIQYLLTKPTISEAAEAAGVSESTLFRWLNDSLFAEAYANAQTKALENTLACLQNTSSAAVATLRDVLNDPLARPSERISAARAVLEFSLKARETLVINHKLEQLETQLATLFAQNQNSQ